MAAVMAVMPPGLRIDSVEKLVWAPVPFQSPLTGLGVNVHTMP